MSRKQMALQRITAKKWREARKRRERARQYEMAKACMEIEYLRAYSPPNFYPYALLPAAGAAIVLGGIILFAIAVLH